MQRTAIGEGKDYNYHELQGKRFRSLFNCCKLFVLIGLAGLIVELNLLWVAFKLLFSASIMILWNSLILTGIRREEMLIYKFLLNLNSDYTKKITIPSISENPPKLCQKPKATFIQH